MEELNLDQAIDSLDQHKQLDANSSVIGKPIQSPHIGDYGLPALPGSDRSSILRTPGDTGSKYDVGYVEDKPLEDYRFENQSGGAQLGLGLSRLAGSTLLKAAEGISTLASAVGVGAVDLAIGAKNLVSDKHTDLLGLGDITDNPVNSLFYGMEDWWKSVNPVYKPRNWDDKSFLQQLGSTAWWGDEGADAFAYALSTFIPAGVLGKLGLGAKAASMLGATMDIAEDGSMATKGLFSAAENVGAKLGKMGKYGEIANDLLLNKSGLSNPVQFAKNIDILTQNAFMTSSEALQEAQQTGQTITQNYLQKKGKKDISELTPEETKELNDVKSTSMQATFWANMGALAFSNHIEAGMLNKAFGNVEEHEIGKLVDLGDGLDAASKVERKGVSRFLLDTKAGAVLRNIPKYALVEGLYEENIQNAIQNVSTKFGHEGKLDYIKDVLKGTIDDLSDKEAWKSIGAGMVIGALMGSVGSAREHGEQQKAVGHAINNINQARENFVNLNNSLYEKNDDGSVKVDEDNKPVYNLQAITDYAANTNQAKDLADLHDMFKTAGNDNVAKILKDEAFTKYALAHLEAGLGDEFQAKIKALSSYKEEDLAKQGFDPIEIRDGNKVSLTQRAQELSDQATQVQKDYDQVTKTVQLQAVYPTAVENENLRNSRVNEAVKNLSRIRTLDDIISNLDTNITRLKANSITTGENPLVTNINNQARDLEAKKNAFQEGISNGTLRPDMQRTRQLLAEISNQETAIKDLKIANKEELESLGHVISEDSSEIADSNSEAPDTQELKRILKDKEDAKVSKLHLLDRYNAITNVKNGAQNFVNSIANKASNDIARENQIEDENNTSADELSQYKEGDFVEYGDKDNLQKGYVTPDANGNLTVNSQVLSKGFLDRNPNLRKYTPEELQQYKDNKLKEFRKSQIQDRINTVTSRINKLLSRDSEKQEAILNHLINIDELVVSKEKGLGRTSERKLARQIESIQNAINSISQEREELLDEVDKLQSKIEDLKDDQANSDINDNYEQIDTYQKNIDSINEAVKENNSWITKLTDALKTFQNLWKSFFPNKVLNLEKGRKEYTDAKTEIQLTKDQLKDLEQTNIELLDIKSKLEGRIKFLEDEIKDYELQANRLEYNAVADKPETITTDPETPDNETKDRFEEDAKPDIVSQLFKTAGNHRNDSKDGLTQSHSQKVWYKFTEDFDSKNKEGIALRTVTIDDETYGGKKGKKLESLYQNIDKLKFKDRVDKLVKDGIIDNISTTSSGRVIIIANINGEKLPYYRSRFGTSGKTKGAWFPFFGFGKSNSESDTEDWFIKGTKEQLDTNFNSTDVEQYTKLINKAFSWDTVEDNPNIVEGHPSLGHLNNISEEGVNKILYNNKNSNIVNDGGSSFNKALSIIDKIKSKENNSYPEESIFREEPEQYQTINNIKVIAINKNGEPIRRDGSLVYTSLPEINENRTKLEDFPAFRSSNDALNKQAIEQYRAFSEVVKNSKEPVILKITSKSNGVIVPTEEAISAEEAFGTNPSLNIITDEKTTIGGNDYKLPQGLVYVNYNGRPVQAETRTLSPNESKAVLGKLKQYAESRGNSEATDSGRLLQQIQGTIALVQRKNNPEFSIYFVKGKNQLVFGDKIISTEDLVSGKYDQQLREFLDNQNLQISKSLLTKDEEFTDIHDKKWKSYSDYLLTKRDDTPLLFKIKPKSDNINEPQFYNTYLEYSNPKATNKEPASQQSTSTQQSVQSVKDTSLPFITIGSIDEIQSVKEQIEPQQEIELPEEEDVIQPDLLDDLYMHQDNIFKYKEANLEEEKDWFEKNISKDIQYERIKGLVENNAYGKFERAGKILISDIATEGTTYHEAFHVVSQLYLTPTERSSLYQKWRDDNNTQRKITIKEDPLKDTKISKRLTHFRVYDGNKEMGYIGLLQNQDNTTDVFSIDVRPEYKGSRLQDALYQLAIDKAKEWGSDGLVSGHGLYYPEATTKAYSRFNKEILERSKDDTEPKDYPLVKLLGHEDEDIVNNWVRNYEQNGLGDKTVEENLAEEFREYMLTKQSPYKTWFDKIVNFIKGLLGLGNDNKQLLFSRINNGYFKDSNIKSKSDLDLYKMSDKLDTSTTKDLLDSMTLTLVRGLFKNNFSLNDIERFNNELLNEEDTKRFQNLYTNVLSTVTSRMEQSTQPNSEFLKSVADYVKSNKQSVVNDHIAYLTKYGINLKIEEDLNLPEDFERAKDTLGIISAIEFSSKSGMPNVIKLMIASLPKLTINEKGEKAVVLNNLGLPQLSDYRRTTAILTNELANISSFKEQMYKIKQLSENIPELSLLADQLGVSNSVTTTSSLRADYFDLQAKFRQQFDKAYYDFHIQLYDGNNSYLQSSSNDLRTNILARWEGQSFANKKSYKEIDGQKILNAKYFKDKYDKQLKGDEKFQSVLSFYKDLGITFTRPTLVDVDVLADKQKVLLKKIEGNDISSIFQDEAQSKGFVNAILEQEIKSSLDYSDNQHINPEGKTVYNVSLHNYLTRLAEEINNYGLPKELSWDEETQQGNPLLRHSNWKDRIEDGKEIKIGILEGARVDEQGEEGKSTADLTYPDAAAQQFVAVLNGQSPYMRAGDKSLEHTFSFGNRVGFTSIDDITNYFKGTLADELLSSYMLNVEGIGSEYLEYAKSANDLRIFKDALYSVDEKTYQAIINDKTIDRKEAIARIDSFVERDSVKHSIQDWFDNQVKENKQVLLDNNLVYSNMDIENAQHDRIENRSKYITYSLVGIPTELADKFVGKSDVLSVSQMKSLVEQFTYNQLLGNIEQTKLFTGDVAFYKDFFKRTSGLTGTGKTSWTGNEVDEWLNENRPREYQDYKGNIKVDKKSDGKIQSLVFKDVKAVSANFKSYVEDLVKSGLDESYASEILASYNKAYEEGDAQGYLTLPEYREFLTRTGDWTSSHEVLYPKLIRGESISADDLNKFLSGYPVLKPQYFGKQTDGNLFVPTFYKFSVMPLIPSVIRGTELEELMHSMLENGNGMALFQSGNKVGGKTGNVFYDAEGKINLDTKSLEQQEIYYDNLKIQLDINPKTKDKVIFGTQVRKIVLSNLAGKTITINGKKVEGNRLIKAYSDLVKKSVELEYKKLVDRLGIQAIDANNYLIKDVSKLKSILQGEALSRQAPDNLLEGLNQVLEDGNIKQFDVLVNRNKIENILMSLVNNSAIKQKVFGDMRVQGASTGFEAKDSKGRGIEDAKKATWWNKVESVDGKEITNLQFYKPTADGTQPMEILLPHYFKELIGKDIRPEDLQEQLQKIIGYRTPTQAPNSVELMKIKGFLPQEAGNLIVVPSEIVVKAGSDFDIDKLTLHLPYYDMVNGEPKYREYKGNEEDLGAIYNRINDISWKILSAPENFRQLITPNTTGDVEKIAKQVKKLKGGDNIADGKGKNIGWKKNLDIREAYLLGKAGIGITALHNVHHILSQIVGLTSKPGVRINLDHLSIEDKINFAGEREVGADPINSETILENLSAFMNGFVDIAKNPFLKDINANVDTAGTYFYLLRAGVPLKQVIMFMNQPIISDYLIESARNNSLALKATGNKLSESDLLIKVLDKYSTSYPKIDFTNQKAVYIYKQGLKVNNLQKNISNYESNNETNGIQKQILLDYLQYKDDSDKMSDLIKATTADTRGTGATMNSAQSLIDNFDNIKENSIFENVEKYIDETFVGAFHQAVQSSIKMYSNMFYTEKNSVKEALSEIKQIANLSKFSDVEKVMNLAKNDIINYTLQTNPINNNSLMNTARDAFSGENSVAKLLAKAKENEKIANNPLIRELFPIISSNALNQVPTPKDLDNIKMFSKKLEAADANIITEGWKELFSTEPELAEKLMLFTVMQSGLNNSPINFTQFIPNEYYVPFANKLLGDNSIDHSSFVDKFFRNNYKNDDLVPSIKKYVQTRNGELTIANSKEATVLLPKRNPLTGRLMGQDKSNYSYVKAWNNTNKEYELYKNTGLVNSEGTAVLFERVSRLGDGYNFKEWTDESIILTNRINNKSNSSSTLTSVVNNNLSFAKLQDMIDSSNITQEEKDKFSQKLSEAKNMKDLSDILKDICT